MDCTRNCAYLPFPCPHEIEGRLRDHYPKTLEKQADEKALSILPVGLDLLKEQDRLMELVEQTH